MTANNRKTVMKALECCSGTVDDVLKVDCDKCPYDIGSAECKGLERDALAVIKELSVELEGMRAAADAYKIYIVELTNKNEKIGIENSRIKEGIVRSMQQRLKEAVCNNTYPDVNKEGKPINVWKAKTGYATIDQIASGVIDQITKEMTARSVAKSITEEKKND